MPIAFRVFAAASPIPSSGQSGTTEAPSLADLPLSIGVETAQIIEELIAMAKQSRKP